MNYKSLYNYNYGIYIIIFIVGNFYTIINQKLIPRGIILNVVGLTYSNPRDNWDSIN